MHVARAIAENFAHCHPNHQLRLCIFLQQRIVIIDARDALKPQPVWLFEIDEQHADLEVPEQVTHRIEHAVAIIARKCDGLTVENANEPWIAALVGDSGSTLVIYGRQKEHVTAFDECFVLSRNLCQHHARFNVVSKPPRVEAVLQ